MTSTDYTTTALDDFPASWDFLRLSSPQFTPPGDAPAPDSVRGVAVASGDFSDDRAAATDIGALVLGDNVVVATQQGDLEPGGRDRDYFTFTVGEGQVLSQLVLQGFATDETGLPQGFIGIQAGAAVTTNPDTFEGAGGLLGGLVYNGGLTGNDMLADLGEGEEQGSTFIGFDAPLTAGTYTIWLNRGGQASTATLNFIVTEAPVADLVISIADAPTVQENGDTEATLLTFPLTASEGFTGIVTVAFDVGGESRTALVSFDAGLGSLAVGVPSDDAANGDDAVTVTLTGASAGGGDVFTLGAATATGTVADDDAAASQFQRGAVVAAVNAGGPAMVFDGISFAAATSGTTNPFSGGEQFTDNTAGNGEQTVFDGTVYETKINGAADGSFAFSAVVDPGKLYFVDLYLAEIYQSEADQRVFDVFVEGGAAPVLDDFDIVATTGGANTPVVVQLAEPIAPGANGAIDLSFIAGTDRAKVSAIVIREAVLPPPDGQVSIADAPTLQETGDTGVTTLVFPLPLTGPDAIVTVGYTVNGVAGSAEVTSVSGAALLQVEVRNDNLADGPNAVAVVLTGVAEAGFTIAPAADAATGSVTEDDFAAGGTGPDGDLDGDGAVNGADPDIDGDGLPNGDETFFYDASNQGRALAAGETVTFDFNTAGTPFQNGLTGALLSNKATPPELNPANAAVSGGSLNVRATNGDHFGANNTQENALVAGFRSAEGLRVETRFAAPDFNAGTNGQTQSVNFQSTDVVVGFDQNNLVKAVFGRTGPGFELAQDNAPGGLASAVTPSIAMPLTAVGGYAAVTEILIALEVFIDVTGPVPLARATAFATLFGADGSPLAGLENFAIGTITLEDVPQVTNGTAGTTLATRVLQGGVLGAGVIQTSTSGQAQFDVSYQYLKVAALGTPVDLPPVVDAGIDAQSATEDAAFSFAVPADAFADDGGSLVLSAALASGGALPAWLRFDAATGVFSGTPENADVGVLSVAVSASDGTNPPVAAVFELAVANVNDAPTIVGSVAAQVATAGQGGTIDLSGLAVADIDVGDAATLQARLTGGDPLPEGLVLSGGMLEVAPTLAAGTYAIEIYAEDQSQAESAQRVSFTLSVDPAPNTPPTATPIDAATLETDAPRAINLLAGAADGDGGMLAVSVTSVLDAGGAAVLHTLESDGMLTVDPAQFAAALAAGDSAIVTVSYLVTDGQGGATPNTATLTIAGVDGPFSFYLDADGDGFGGDSIVTAYQAPDGHVAQPGDADDADATIFPGAPEINDGKDNDQNGEIDDLDVAPVAGADAATAPENGSVVIAVADLLANDSDANLDGLAVSGVGNAVNGTVTFDPVAQTVTFTPTPDHFGAASFEYTVSDGFGGSATGIVSVDVAETANAAPVVGAPIPAQSALQGAVFAFAVPALAFADDAGTGALTLTASLADGNPLPTWLTFDPATGLAGTPANDDVGSLSVRVTATDAGGLSASQDFAVNVDNVNDAPGAANGPADQSGKVGEAFALTLGAGLFTDPDLAYGDTVTLSAAGLPAGVTFNPTTGAFAGAPT